MIRIFCSKPTAMKLSLDVEPCTEEMGLLDKWRMSIRDYAISASCVLMNVDTQFGFAIGEVMGLTQKEFLEMVEDGMKKAFLFYGVRKEIMEEYFSGGIQFCLGSDRSEQAKLGAMDIGADLLVYSQARSEWAFLRS